MQLAFIILLYSIVALTVNGERYLDDFEDLYLNYLMKRDGLFHQHSDVPLSTGLTKMTIKMPGVTPNKHDSYICTSLKMPKEDTYLVGFEPTAEMNTAHHMLMFGCSEPFSYEKTWNCGEMKPVCSGMGQRIMYAWGRNAPKLSLPKGVGFRTGGTSDVKYIVLQVHYGNVDKFADGKMKDYSGVVLQTTFERQKYFAGIYLLADGWSSIPPHQKKWHIDTSCEFTSKATIYPFAYRVHAHKLGDVISGYRVRDGNWKMIGKGDPQRPQAFYPLKTKLNIQEGDALVAQCTYNSIKRDTVTRIGATMLDEMCNFYIMYFYDHDKYPIPPPIRCGDVGPIEQRLYESIPFGSDVPLPGGHPIMAGMKGMHGGTHKRETVRSYKAKGDLLSGLSGTAFEIKQVCGVDVTADQKQVVALHRGDRSWDSNSFDNQERFNSAFGKIHRPTLLWVDIVTGKQTKEAGKSLFYLPHGLTIDAEDNIWITDVGAHQVFKFKKDVSEPELVLGNELEPGSDYNHFCKPTDVAVNADGSFFVSDGYCNERVMMFSPSGKLSGIIMPSNSAGLPRPALFAVPHSISLDSKRSMLYVADRENNRVLKYNSKSGAFDSVFVKLENPIYAIAVEATLSGGFLHAVTFPNELESKSKGFSFDLISGKLVTSWQPSGGFHKPHDLAVTRNGQYLFAVEIGPARLWQFNNDNN